MESFTLLLLVLGLSGSSFARTLYDDRLVISPLDYESFNVFNYKIDSDEDLSTYEVPANAYNIEFIPLDNNHEVMPIENDDDGDMLTDDNNINNNDGIAAFDNKEDIPTGDNNINNDEVISNEENDDEDIPTDNNINTNAVLSNEDDDDTPTDSSIGEEITTDMAADSPDTSSSPTVIFIQQETPTPHRDTKRYKLFKKKMNFFKAMEHCSQAGMRLATFSNEKEYDQLTRRIKKTNRDMTNGFWVGATDLGETNTYKWLSTGRELTYTRWHSGEPSHHGYHGYLGYGGYGGYGYVEIEHCVEIAARFNYDMNDKRCSDEQQFVCEKLPLV